MRQISAGIIVATRELEEALLNCLQDLPVRVLFEISELPEDWSDFLERIERTRPDVVILDVTKLREPMEQVIQRIRSTKYQPAVCVLNKTKDPEAILTAFRAGATEFLSPPFGQALRDALEHIAKIRETTPDSHHHNGKVFAFVSAKGGCGATTIACHVALELASRHCGKALLADLDLESGLIGFLLKSDSAYSIADAARNLNQLDDSYWAGLVYKGIPDVDVITAPPAATPGLVSIDQVEPVVVFTRTLYDWVVFDLGRNLSAYALSILGSIDGLYLVTTYEIPALHQAKGIIQSVLRAGFSQDRLHLIMNRMPKHTDVTVDEIGKMFGLPVSETIPNDYVSLQEAYTERRLLGPESMLGKSYGRLAAHMAGLEEKKRKLSLFG
jgi:pilus assembly protein CpaE